MKKYILIAAASLIGSAAFAQAKGTYCNLDVYRPGFNRYVAIADYGDGHKANAQNALKDASGKVIKFASEGAALNYMTKQGWELVTATRQKSDEVHFYLKKDS